MPKPGEKVVNTNAKPQVQNNEFIDGLMGFHSVKNIQVNYTEKAVRLPKIRQCWILRIV
jgi:hypothetical protein